MSLFELIGGLAAEAFHPAQDDLPGRGGVYLDGRWEEGELFIGPQKVIWNEQIIFSRDEGWVERITDADEAWQIHPNLVVLHFRRPHDVVLLAVHRRQLDRIGKVLPLPEISSPA